MQSLPVEVRFWNKVEKTNGCWLWKAAQNPKGYGCFNPVKGDMVLAHRWSWQNSFGPIPDGQFVLHRCDVTSCVRPDHLFLGTLADNNTDMRKKARHARGDTHGRRVLTERDVAEIRKLYAKGVGVTDISRRFGVVHPTISLIVHRKTWTHI